jgi:hypothetical protein
MTDLFFFCGQAGIEKSPLSLLGIVGAASIALWLVSFLLLRGGGVAGFMVEALLALPASFVICGPCRLDFAEPQARQAFEAS